MWPRIDLERVTSFRPWKDFSKSQLEILIEDMRNVTHLDLRDSQLFAPEDTVSCPEYLPKLKTVVVASHHMQTSDLLCFKIRKAQVFVALPQGIIQL